MADTARGTFDAIAEAVTATTPAVTGRMFSMPCLMINGKAFAGLYGEAMVFKLTGEAHATALALSGAHLFDPSGIGRAMKEWVQVPFANAESWADLGEAARIYVERISASRR